MPWKYLQTDGDEIVACPENQAVIDMHVHLGDPLQLPLLQVKPDASAPHRKMKYFFAPAPRAADLQRLFYMDLGSNWLVAAVKGLPRLWNMPGVFKRMTVANLWQDMQKNGIAEAAVLALERKPGKQHSERLQASLSGQDKLHFFCSVHPLDPRFRTKIAHFVSQGAKGLKLHPRYQGIRPDKRPTLTLLEEWARHRLPVLIHSGIKEMEPSWMGRREDVRHIREIVRMFPNLPFVLAHMGYSQQQETMQLAREQENVFLETSFQPYPRIFEAIQRVGSDRVVFGSDWALGNPAYALASALKATEGSRLVRRRVLWHNAQGLLAPG